MTSTSLLIGVLASAMGMGYFVYGKKQQMYIPMVAGVALCVYPYFVSNIYLMIGVGVVLMALPFFLRF